MAPGKVLEQCVAQMHKRPIIRIGSSGPLVREWQVLMQREMQAPIKPTGVFDAATLAATRAFQRKVRIPDDGVVASKTWAAAAVAPCYALALAKQRQPAVAKPKSHWWSRRGQASAIQKPPVHGLGAMDLSFSVLDVKSMVLGGVLGLGLGAVLFRRK